MDKPRDSRRYRTSTISINTTNLHTWNWPDSASDFSVTLDHADAIHVVRACRVLGCKPERLTKAALALLASAGGAPILDPLAGALLAVLRTRYGEG